MGYDFFIDAIDNNRKCISLPCKCAPLFPDVKFSDTLSFVRKKLAAEGKTPYIITLVEGNHKIEELTVLQQSEQLDDVNWKIVWFDVELCAELLNPSELMGFVFNASQNYSLTDLTLELSKKAISKCENGGYPEFGKSE